MSKAAAAAAAKVALENLLAGNQRFCQNLRAPRDFSLRREKLLKGQRPMAAILGCADSRVSPELLFDKNLGEIFVVRTAGQVVDSMALASLEYAVEHLQVPLLLILGHERCGAVKAAVAQSDHLQGHVGQLLQKIQPAIARAKQLQPPPENFLEAVVDQHILEVATQVFRDSDIIRLFVQDGKLKVVLAKYLLAHGVVKIINPDFRP